MLYKGTVRFGNDNETEQSWYLAAQATPRQLDRRLRTFLDNPSSRVHRMTVDIAETQPAPQSNLSMRTHLHNVPHHITERVLHVTRTGPLIHEAGFKPDRDDLEDLHTCPYEMQGTVDNWIIGREYESAVQCGSEDRALILLQWEIIGTHMAVGFFPSPYVLPELAEHGHYQDGTGIEMHVNGRLQAAIPRILPFERKQPLLEWVMQAYPAP